MIRFVWAMIAAMRDLWEDSEPPETGRSPNRRAALASGHALIGALVAVVLPLPMTETIIVALVGYWIAKELGDLRRGGKIWDGVSDTCFVAAGAAYGVWWWPLLIAGLVVLDQTGVKLQDKEHHDS